MIRTFSRWFESLPIDLKEQFHYNNKETPPLNLVNYFWVTNLIGNVSEEMNPTVEELLNWIKTGQVEAKRK